MASNGLITDLYQLTMANALFKKGMHERKVVFDRFYRKNPFDGGYTVVAGIQHLVDFVKNFRYDAEDIEYLRSLGIFYPEFLDYLKETSASMATSMPCRKAPSHFREKSFSASTARPPKPC